MQKEKILNVLYHGNLSLVVKSVVPGSEFQKIQREIVELEENSMTQLDEQQNLL